MIWRGHHLWTAVKPPELDTTCLCRDGSRRARGFVRGFMLPEGVQHMRQLSRQGHDGDLHTGPAGGVWGLAERAAHHLHSGRFRGAGFIRI